MNRMLDPRFHGDDGGAGMTRGCADGVRNVLRPL
jgi:hypothetical protein